MDTISPIADITYSNPIEVEYLSLAAKRGLNHRAKGNWAIDKETIEKLAPEISNTDNYGHDGILDTEADVLTYFSFDNGSGNLKVLVAGETTKVIADKIDELKKQLPEKKAPPSDEVRVRFWMKTPHGPKAIVRNIEVPTWEEIQGNYAGGTRRQLDPLVDKEWRPNQGGQLVLWHGEPGTGKTYTLRALTRAWKDWCDFDYVSDPEEFFGQAAYLLQVLVDSEYYGGDRWRLIILEDAGELMSADARQRTGQGLSRLLNVTDGLIGQGLKVMVLITTNEEVQNLHPAVSRPGRCATHVKFDSLDASEIQAWYQAHSHQPSHTINSHSKQTVAELYAQVEEDKRLNVAAPKQKVGFAK